MLFASFTPAFAKSTTTTNGNAYGMNYTQITGVLQKANYVIYIPESWNGRLIIACPGYNFFSDPHQELSFDPLAQIFVSLGYAFASSNYNGGERAWLVTEGIIRIHQLTEHIVDKYHVTGKIFLLGASMGGQIALMLGQKYPRLYSGVLDVCGAKDAFEAYAYAQIWLTHTPAELRIILNIPSVSDSDIQGLQYFFATVWNDIIKSFHGTPDERPQTYVKYDPLFHADMEIPVISLVGALDPIVILPFHLKYQAAVATAGDSELYRLHIVPDGGHCDVPVLAQAPANLIELIAWSDSLTQGHCHGHR
jgi:dipeptidyl aminopeptidase/acylaminoacyl peptidase